MKWNADAVAAGERRRVFCMSMADAFDAEVAQEHRDRLWALTAATPQLDWLVLTKRPANIRRMLPADYEDVTAWKCVNPKYQNLWFGTSIELQKHATPRLTALLDVPAGWRVGRIGQGVR